VRGTRLTALVVVSIAAVLPWRVPAHAAAVRRVSPTGADTGDCTVDPCKTVGYTIDQSVDGDAIQIAAGTYAEALVVDRSVTLVGAGRWATFVDDPTDGIAASIGSSSQSVNVTVSRLTIEHGHNAVGNGIVSDPGTGFENAIALDRVTIRRNRAMAIGLGASGGGVYNADGSSMSIRDSLVSENTTVAAPRYEAAGGGIYNGGTLVMSASTVRNNAAEHLPCFGLNVCDFAGGNGVGGGIANSGALTLRRSSVSGNSALAGGGRPGGTGSGGGIDNSGTLTAIRATLSGNIAGGGFGAYSCHRGFCNRGAAGPGAGGGVSGPVTLVNSTIAGNVAVGGSAQQGGNAQGGGVSAAGTVMILNSTIAGNDAKPGPGTTVATGAGGGMRSAGALLTNSIIANNTATTGTDCFGTVSSGGHNLLGDDASCTGFTASGDQVNADPMLGPLEDNGGFASTMALRPGSPAIDAADDSVCAAPPVASMDERGVHRPKGAHCDIGAFEKRAG
jgi:hypothetical protein